MVTSTDKNHSKSTDDPLQKLLNKSNRRWDLQQPEKRDAWMLRTLQRLEKAGDDVLTAVRDGPPTPEWLMEKNCSLTPRQAEKMSGELMENYLTANAVAYDILLDRIDLEKRPTLASGSLVLPRLVMGTLCGSS